MVLRARLCKQLIVLKLTLNQHYLIAERIMSLRNPDTDELNSTLKKIDQVYVELVSNLADSKVD